MSFSPFLLSNSPAHLSAFSAAHSLSMSLHKDGSNCSGLSFLPSPFPDTEMLFSEFSQPRFFALLSPNFLSSQYRMKCGERRVSLPSMIPPLSIKLFFAPRIIRTFSYRLAIEFLYIFASLFSPLHRITVTVSISIVFLLCSWHKRETFLAVFFIYNTSYGPPNRTKEGNSPTDDDINTTK